MCNYCQRNCKEVYTLVRIVLRIEKGWRRVLFILAPALIPQAAAAGLRSLFVGFETLNPKNLRKQRKYQNLDRDYSAAVHRLHENEVMVNASFVFGMDEDDEDTFDRTIN